MRKVLFCAALCASYVHGQTSPVWCLMRLLLLDVKCFLPGHEVHHDTERCGASLSTASDSPEGKDRLQDTGRRATGLGLCADGPNLVTIKLDMSARQMFTQRQNSERTPKLGGFQCEPAGASRLCALCPSESSHLDFWFEPGLSKLERGP